MNINWEEVRNIVAWVVSALAAVLIAWAPVKCTMDSNERISAAVEAGVNPIDAQCSFGIFNDQSKCAIRAAVSEKK